MPQQHKKQQLYTYHNSKMKIIKLVEPNKYEKMRKCLCVLRCNFWCVSIFYHCTNPFPHHCAACAYGDVHDGDGDGDVFYLWKLQYHPQPFRNLPSSLQQSCSLWTEHPKLPFWTWTCLISCRACSLIFLHRFPWGFPRLSCSIC